MSVLFIKNLIKNFGFVEVICGVDLEVEKGEIYVVIGFNGVGKFIFFNLFFGVFVFIGGEIWLNGECIDGFMLEKIQQCGLFWFFQVSNVFVNFFVFENLCCVCFKIVGFGYVFWCLVSKIKVVNECVEEVLEMIGLQVLCDVLVGVLFYVSQCVLEIGMIIVCGVEVVIFDEFIVGMSNIEIVQVISLICQVVQGCILMIVEYDMGVVFELVDCILVLVYGKIVVIGILEEICNDLCVKEVYLGEEVV